MKITVEKTDYGKQITVSGLSLQFDAGPSSKKSPKRQALDAIDIINLELQREPYGIAAQIYI